MFQNKAVLKHSLTVTGTVHQLDFEIGNHTPNESFVTCELPDPFLQRLCVGRSLCQNPTAEVISRTIQSACSVARPLPLLSHMFLMAITIICDLPLYRFPFRGTFSLGGHRPISLRQAGSTVWGGKNIRRAIDCSLKRFPPGLLAKGLFASPCLTVDC